MRLCKCGAFIEKGLCERCKTQPTSHKKTTAERGYGHDWRTFSELQRDLRPLCEVCEAAGKVEPTTQMHHIEKIKDAPSRRLDKSNTIAVCNECHEGIEGLTPKQLDDYLERLRNGK